VTPFWKVAISRAAAGDLEASISAHRKEDKINPQVFPEAGISQAETQASS
jgi:hypothetical protein